MIFRLIHWLTRPPHVFIPFETEDSHHRCICSHRRDDHLGHSGWCQSCTCSYFEDLPLQWRESA